MGGAFLPALFNTYNMRYLHIDIETYSPVDLPSSGVHAYAEHPEFEILILAYSLDDERVNVVDVYKNGLPDKFLKLFMDPDIIKVAHNAAFERTCFNALGYVTPIKDWICTAIMAAYCGLPLSLHGVSSALKLGDKSKDMRGRALIKQFSIPQKPSKNNNFSSRNLPESDPAGWRIYMLYCGKDVIAEKEIHRRLKKYKIPEWERENYVVDQEINDRGVLIHEGLARAAYDLAEDYKAELQQEFEALTGVSNPKSPTQIVAYLKSKGINAESSRKEYLNELAGKISDPVVKKALAIRAEISKSSTAKFKAMLDSMSADGRARGTFQFYGARTGRFAGRRIQLQNMTKDKGEIDLDFVRQLLIDRDFDTFKFMFPDVQATLSQLVRTAIVAPKGKSFMVADFSAIEARVIAWISGEDWRLKVFRTHGKIYEASASMMFNVPLDSIDSKSPLRQKGKVAELALGYQGAIGAMRTMGGEKMGLSEQEMKDIVQAWRAKSQKIVQFWGEINEACIYATRNPGQPVKANSKISVVHDGTFLIIRLTSGRCLFYPYAKMGVNQFGGPSVQYYGQKEGKMCWLDAYGGSFTENIVQALARDLLMYAIQQLKIEGYQTVLHVHDEAAVEVDDEKATPEALENMYKIMCRLPEWAIGLPLAADGFISKYYKK